VGFTTGATTGVVAAITLATNNEVVTVEARSCLNRGRVGSVTNDDSVSVKENGA
jgi:ABC-type enterobactin transport system permease subunit